MKQIAFFTILLCCTGIFNSCYVHSGNIGQWQKIGERSVNLTLDRDVIRCSHKGMFRALKFRVEKAPVSFLRVSVRYANGTVDNLPFVRMVRPGGESPYLDLRGDRRVIREIVLYYKAEKRERGVYRHSDARVQVWARH